MIQFKRIPFKSAILLLLFLTTTATGYLRNTADEYRTTRADGNVRETLLSMDRREENVQVQNLPIRKLHINRQINEKDGITERLYDRRSFRTGNIERILPTQMLDRQQNTPNRDTTRASRDIRDVNNNRREIVRRRTSDSTIIRETVENRRIAERAAISKNRYSDDERRSSVTNIRTDRQNIERRIAPERRVLHNRLASESRNTRDIRDARTPANIRQTKDRRTNELQRRSVELTTRNLRYGERQETLNRQNRFADRSIQRRSIRENNPHHYSMRSRKVSDRDSQISEKRSLESISRRSFEGRRSMDHQNRGLSEARTVDQSRLSDIPSTERLEMRERNFETRASNRLDWQRSVERREDDVPRRMRTRFIREQSERDSTEFRYSTRTADRQNRRSSERRDVERNLALEDRRLTARSSGNQDRRSSLVRTADRARSLDRQGSTERLDRARDGVRNFLAVSQSRLSDRRLDKDVSREDYTRRNSYQTRSMDQRRQRSVDAREDRNVRVQDESRSDSTRNIRDSTQFRRDSRNNRITDRRDSKRETQREKINNRQRLNMSSKNENIRTDRYNELTVDSRRYFERLVSQRSTDADRVAFRTTRNIDDLQTKVDSNLWANTAKIILAAFLIGQIFVNTSKQNKFRFQNIMSMATFTKEKMQ